MGLKNEATGFIYITNLTMVRTIKLKMPRFSVDAQHQMKPVVLNAFNDFPRVLSHAEMRLQNLNRKFHKISKDSIFSK